MKKLFYIFLAALALGSLNRASAQTVVVAEIETDSLLLGERFEEESLVRTLLLRRPAEEEYTLHYRINLATLNPALAGNGQQLGALDDFLQAIERDTLSAIRSIVITGYASPDGPDAFNEKLAARRAEELKAHLDKRYNLSKRYHVTTRSLAEDWRSSATAITASQVPDRQAVVRILNDPQTSDQRKELSLKELPSVWEYLRTEVLPPLRRAEVEIDYGAGEIASERIVIVAEQPAETEACEEPSPCNACPCAAFEDAATGILVEMPVDCKACRRATR